MILEQRRKKKSNLGPVSPTEVRFFSVSFEKLSAKETPFTGSVKQQKQKKNDKKSLLSKKGRKGSCSWSQRAALSLGEKESSSQPQTANFLPQDRAKKSC
eukprot:TRINITY_DN3183_c0_g2_i1.p2 TRINITY_DN3183_c0_g2~~TRINITY_DN3183_c0_g2_i1.p2  ORF type:complete len:100 (+),score=3.58 TRINITY_DN3183_c0_g2_i1:1107-1406(+)